MFSLTSSTILTSLCGIQCVFGAAAILKSATILTFPLTTGNATRAPVPLLGSLPPLEVTHSSLRLLRTTWGKGLGSCISAKFQQCFLLPTQEEPQTSTLAELGQSRTPSLYHCGGWIWLCRLVHFCAPVQRTPRKVQTCFMHMYNPSRLLQETFRI